MNVLNSTAEREDPNIDWVRVEDWVRRHLLGAFGDCSRELQEPMRVEQFTGGHSNLTYLIRFGTCHVVLRKAPPGPLPHAAHDMARECRWLAALNPVFPLAPRPYLLCEDPDVAGSAFFIMERRHGIVVRADEPAQLYGDEMLRRRVGEAVVDTLARLHSIDISDAALSSLGKPTGFVGRQLRGWSERWERFKTFDVPELDAIARWLTAHQPVDTTVPGIVHGDFKLDNLMLDAEHLDCVVAVFDWEMSALGDPLVDLGMLLAYWVPSAPPEHRDALTTVTDRRGWPTREQIIERYANQSSRRLDALLFFEIFAFFKIAVVLQQIYYRFVHGEANDPRFAALSRRVTYLARSAVRLIEVA